MTMWAWGYNSQVCAFLNVVCVKCEQLHATVYLVLWIYVVMDSNSVFWDAHVPVILLVSVCGLFFMPFERVFFMSVSVNVHMYHESLMGYSHVVHVVCPQMFHCHSKHVQYMYLLCLFVWMCIFIYDCGHLMCFVFSVTNWQKVNNADFNFEWHLPSWQKSSIIYCPFLSFS